MRGSATERRGGRRFVVGMGQEGSSVGTEVRTISTPRSGLRTNCGREQGKENSYHPKMLSVGIPFDSNADNPSERR